MQNSALSVSATVLLLLLLETGAHILIGMEVFGKIEMTYRRFYISPDVANRKPMFWGDFSKEAGRWRVANASHTAHDCMGNSIPWHSNSVGASDRERSIQKRDSSQKRVAILGDSFMEGMLVNAQYRLSNRLEAGTGHEHLNFAVNGSSPINYYLVYKNIAKRFEHDVVLIGLLPANDFQDYTPDQAYKLVEWPIYRPYWQGTYPAYSLKYSLTAIEQSISRNNRTTGGLLSVVDSVYSQLPIADRLKADILLNSGIFKIVQTLSARWLITKGRLTQYEQFPEANFLAMRYSLEQIVAEAKGRKVVLLSIPIQNDIEAIRNGHKNQLDGRLRKFCDQHHILFVPLLPHFLAYKGNVADLFVTCDGHWSKKGEQFVSDLLLQNRQYRSLLTN
ncbi:GDSL-type esterase/lipase family protein [Spirosoma utsteinense]|uniref:SGNH hydrolase-type esterase domain-containing protein n=1 Tax=Spirosoma utsteinense TaxID=2585773 RepID=A0ABR6W8P6_9BACT|nr:GDSL-type esterase/lipase family protein [Spirosoma utsteinense]MBC3787265.1 hypothetical protein [Spirosoma utsteinense]MBC3792951.1 hypothetical protein [Spirosoma utsteinense]